MIDPPVQWFTREGGTLYSPIHGIEVVIPPDAPPLGVDKFWLSIHVYPRRWKGVSVTGTTLQCT